MTRVRISHPYLALLLVLLLVGWFGSLEHRGLFNPDEGRYAEIPREMLATGDWTTPRLNDLKYFEKPPLQYWLTALSFAAFGEDEWTARLPTALLGFAALWFVAWTARRLWGPRAALLASAFLGSCWGFYICGQYLTLDMTLSAFLTFALCAFILAQRAATDALQRNWMLVAWIGAALAMLAKGLIALVLPGLSLLVYSLVTRDWRVWRRLHLSSGLPLFALLALPWFVMVQARNPEFFEFFVLREHFQRFLETNHARLGPWWYYVPIALVGTMPWTPLVVARMFAPASSTPAAHREFDVDRFCLSWALVILAFFSVSKSKLPAYVVPMLPALALWTCHLANHARLAALRHCGALLVAVGLAGGGMAALWLPAWPRFGALGQAAHDALPIVVASMLALAAAGGVALFAARRGRAQAAILSLVAGSLLFWAGLFGFLHQTDASFSSERIIEDLSNDTKPFEPGVPFYSVGMFDPSLPFYLGRPVTLVKTRGELGPGIDLEPLKQVATMGEFRRLWTDASEQAYAAMTLAQFAELKERDVPMTQVIADQRLIVVKRFGTGAPQPAR